MGRSGSREGGEQQGEGQGERSGHPPNKFGFAKSRILGRLEGIEATDGDNSIVGDME